MSGIDEVLADARRGWVRMEPADAAEAMRDGALLVDTRPVEQRERDGEIAGAIVIDRNVLEWRLDPTGPHCIPEIAGPEQTVIVICNQGYSSSLAAATLHRLGLRNATDVIGGFEAWVACGLQASPGRAATR
jgi:rhodanese-related sulfurtransferase